MGRKLGTGGARRRTEPSIRDRFVMRARHLKGRGEFREALERERAAWDARFSRFAIGKVGLPPNDTLAEHGPYPAASAARRPHLG